MWGQLCQEFALPDGFGFSLAWPPWPSCTAEVGKTGSAIDVGMEEDTKQGKRQEIEDDGHVEQVDNHSGADMHNWVPEADHVENGTENDGGGEQVDACILIRFFNKMIMHPPKVG